MWAASRRPRLDRHAHIGDRERHTACDSEACLWRRNDIRLRGGERDREIWISFRDDVEGDGLADRFRGLPLREDNSPIAGVVADAPGIKFSELMNRRLLSHLDG